MIFRTGCRENEFRMLNSLSTSLKGIPEKPLKERYTFTGRELPALNLGEWQSFMMDVYQTFWDHSEPSYYLFGFVPVYRGCGMISLRRKMRGNNDFSSAEKNLTSELSLHLENFMKLRCLTMHWQKQGGVKAYFNAKGLTQRETEVAIMVLQGMSIPKICTALNISELTARDHLKRIYQKLDVHSKSELVSSYIRAWEEAMKNSLGIQPGLELPGIKSSKKYPT